MVQTTFWYKFPRWYCNLGWRWKSRGKWTSRNEKQCPEKPNDIFGVWNVLGNRVFWLLFFFLVSIFRMYSKISWFDVCMVLCVRFKSNSMIWSNIQDPCESEQTVDPALRTQRISADLSGPRRPGVPVRPAQQEPGGIRLRRHSKPTKKTRGNLWSTKIANWKIIILNVFCR